ncbi:hypothetical protein NO559_16215 [Dasania sp. GY-MA-18]|uniref:Lipoprotein n=1 Tax=Dasania phycosphaerae TaxID=2950436 RepID=A0A9J6RSB5_9GAMM|nr:MULTISPECIES: hypothetical protein [Dasania]MCR8924320.1 hypothetical protein [Dasania sp. GY-MA-18]MCZ0866973.1 hypothetical protein [Dasania phycosphaerae]MCZ0870477.1 hypothetical protein [Dasania phycosphaerae]
MSLIEKVIIGLLVCMLAACSADTQNQTTVAERSAVTLQLAKKSVINKGAGIKLSFNSEDVVQVGSELRVVLLFKAMPNQRIDLQFSDSPDAHLLIAKEQSLITNQQGELTLDLVLIPLQAGKIYIKFFAHAERDGQLVPQVFSIPVYVGDEEGVVPYQQSTESQPVVMPANRF